MKCKFCQAELEQNSSVCPECGKDNLKDNLKGLKITALVLTCVVMLVLLIGLVCYGVTGSFLPWQSGDTEDTTGAAGETESVYGEEFYEAMEEVVATLGEHTLTNRQLQLYYWMVAYTYATDADFTVPMDEQIYDEESGQTYHEYILEKALEAWQELVLMADQASEHEYVMHDDYISYLDSMEDELTYYAYLYYGLSSADEMVQMQFGPGCDYAAYYEYAYNYYYGGLYWSEMLTNLDVTEDEINAYFAENEESLANDYDLSVTKDFGNLIDIRNILIAVPTTEDGEADWDSCLTSAQAVLDEWKNGEMTEESFIALVEKYSEDSGSNTYEGLYTDLYKGSMAEVDVRHILIVPEGGTLNDDGYTSTYTDEEWANALTEAEAILNQWLAGDMTEDSFAELANANSDDNNGNVTNGGLYEDVYMGKMVEEFEQWCFDESRQSGDYGIVQTVYGYHIMYFVHGDWDMDNWISAEGRVAGDVEMVKTDAGYQILYYVEAEPAWYRYSRFGAQALKADDLLTKLIEENPYTLNEDAVVIGQIS